MHRNVTEKNVRHRALKDCKKAGVGPLAAMYVRSGFFIPRASCKPSRERMCLGAMPGGVRGARWTQINATARADVPCRPLEWRLPRQMVCGKAWNRALTAVRGRLGFFLQITARADIPCRPLERRLPCQMIFRKAWNRALTAVRGRLGVFLQITARANVPWSVVWRGSLCSMDTNQCHRAS